MGLDFLCATHEFKALKKSIGAKETRELAVMVDTFKPLLMTEYASIVEDKDYYLSWLTK